PPVPGPSDLPLLSAPRNRALLARAQEARGARVPPRRVGRERTCDRLHCLLPHLRPLLAHLDVLRRVRGHGGVPRAGCVLCLVVLRTVPARAARRSLARPWGHGGHWNSCAPHRAVLLWSVPIPT